MAYHERTRTAPPGISSRAPSYSSADDGAGRVIRGAARSDALDGADRVVARTGISIYGCSSDEAAAFREAAPRFGVIPTIIDAAIAEHNVGLAFGNRCISVSHKTPVTNATLRLLSDAGVEYISTRSAGRNHIDLDVARSLGITVEGVDYAPDGVADYTLMLMLMALRNARSIVIRAEANDFRLNVVRGKELGDLTIGVIGTGRIGAAVMQRLHGFGCRVLAYDRNPKTPADHVPLDELLERSDLITLHTPLTSETRHLLDRRRIAQLKPGAVIVNTGRGALIDTAALLDALECGAVGGAALDVVEEEDGIFYADRRRRPIESQLFVRLQRHPNVLITPHTAYFTERALADTVEHTILNCIAFGGTQHG
ncbi:D-lactate dehydrogenase VanH-A [Agromyces sp. S2-1-8]|nr:NAD(P)-dependent oxidoreductase [Agromyces sp. S2-1-8]MCD5347270.1 D-lactate dehydrogenase VanH-A [Agromyces sp. S2-1-8]